MEIKNYCHYYQYIPMLKKINKKVLFRFSLIISGIATLFFSSAKDDSGVMQSLDNALPSVASLLKVEKVYATDSSGDCCGSSDGGITYPSPTSSAGAIRFANPTGNNFSCGGGGGGGGGDGGQQQQQN
jgi:hypothetical protein